MTIEANLQRTKGRFLLLSLLVLALDQWTKHLVEIHLESWSVVPVVPGFLNFVHVRNTGVAFGLFPARDQLLGTVLLVGLGLFALGFVLYYFLQAHPREKMLLTSLSLVLGGAVGNLLDRIASGGVTDFIDVYWRDWHWHTFNVADSAISVGIALLLLSSFRSPPEAETASADEPEAPAEPSGSPESA